MREVWIVIAIFLLVGTMVFLWFGGFGLMILGAILVLVCASGMGTMAGPPHDISLAQTMIDDTRSRLANISKRRVFLIALPFAVALLVIGFFLSDVEGPLKGVTPVVV